jgi:hypothetical protein
VGSSDQNGAEAQFPASAEVHQFLTAVDGGKSESRIPSVSPSLNQQESQSGDREQERNGERLGRLYGGLTEDISSSGCALPDQARGSAQEVRRLGREGFRKASVGCDRRRGFGRQRAAFVSKRR